MCLIFFSQEPSLLLPCPKGPSLLSPVSPLIKPTWLLLPFDPWPIDGSPSKGCLDSWVGAIKAQATTRGPETRVPPPSVPSSPEAASWCALGSPTHFPRHILAPRDYGERPLTPHDSSIKMGGPPTASGWGLGEDTQPVLPAKRESTAICPKLARSPCALRARRASPPPRAVRPPRPAPRPPPPSPGCARGHGPRGGAGRLSPGTR